MKISTNLSNFKGFRSFFGIALVVSDNDGSAFITKAEFDSLKNNFQAQIDNYNSSIDSKIDGAIAAYLAGIKIGNTVSIGIVYNDQNPTGLTGSEFVWYKNISAVQDKFSKLDWQWVGCDEDVYATKIEGRKATTTGWQNKPSQRYMKFFLKIKNPKYEINNLAGTVTPIYISKYGKVSYCCTGNQVMTCNQPNGWNPFLQACATYPRYSQAQADMLLVNKGRTSISRYAQADGDTYPFTCERDWSTDEPDLDVFAVGQNTYADYETLTIKDRVVKDWQLTTGYPVAVLDLNDQEYCQLENTSTSTFFYHFDTGYPHDSTSDWISEHTIAFDFTAPTADKILEPYGTYYHTNTFWAKGKLSLLGTWLQKAYEGNDIEVDFQDFCSYGDWTIETSDPIIQSIWGLRIKNNKVNTSYSQIPIKWNYERGLGVGTSAGIVVSDKISDDGHLKVTGKASEDGCIGFYCSNTGDYNWGLPSRSNYTSTFKNVTKNIGFTIGDINCSKNSYCFVVFIPNNDNGATITLDSITLEKEN